MIKGISILKGMVDNILTLGNRMVSVYKAAISEDKLIKR